MFSSTTSSNGAAGNSTEYYSYGGLKLHQRGRGLMGFTTNTVRNTTLGTSTTIRLQLDNSWFIPNKTTTVSTAGSMNSSSVTTLTVTSKQDGKNYFVHPTVKEDNDCYGNTVTTTYTHDTTNGCLLSERTEWSTQMYRQTTYDGYAQYGGRWLPSSVTVTQKHEDDPQPFSKTTAYTYNPFGQQTSVCEFSGTPLSLTKEYTYDYAHRLTSETVSGSGVDELATRYEYNTIGQVSRKYTMPASTDVSYTYDTWGNVQTETDNTNVSSPLTTTNEYDGWNRLKKSTSPIGVVTNITRGWGTSAGSKYYVREEAAGSPWKKTVYDAKGRIVDEYTVGEAGVSIWKSISYNSQGLESAVSNRKGNLSVTDSYTYDELGRKLSESSTSGSSATYNYGDKTVTSTVSHTLGDQTYVKTFDNWGNVMTSTDPMSSVTYTYSSNGKPLSAETADGVEVTMTYDAVGNQLSLSDPDAGTTTYEYDALRRVTRQTDARGKVTENVYDALGRIISTSADNEETTYTYGASGNGVMQLTSVSTDDASIAYTYDLYGRVTQETRSLTGESDITFMYAYDSNGNLSSRVCLPIGNTSFCYDQYGFLSRCILNGTDLWQPVADDGLLSTSKILGNLDHTASYDTRGYLTGLSIVNHENTVHQMAFNYDGTNGNLISRSGMMPATEIFHYDPLNRLMATVGDSVPPLLVAYENNGNIAAKVEVGEYSYDSTHPHAVTSVDNYQNIISSDNQAIEYNAYGKISHIEEGDYAMDFIYGPDQQRWKSILLHNGDTVRVTIYAGDYEQVSEGDTIRQFLYGEGNTLCVREQGGLNRYYYMFTDHQGNIVKIVDNSGTSVFEASYDAWGQQIVLKNDIGFHRGYTGHEMMPEFGLINMNGRLYDPLLARFLSPDNYVQLPDFSQSFNRYSYCLNNPLKYTDPSGELFGFDDILVIAAMAYMGGVQANISHAMNNGSNPFNPLSWNWKSFGTYLGIAGGGLNGAGMAGLNTISLNVPGIFTNGAIHAAGNVVLNGIVNLTEHQNFFKSWGLSALAGFAEGALNGYEAAAQKGENFWWGGKVKYNRSQWSLINTDKPDEIITLLSVTGGSKLPNDCVPTTLYEIERVKGGKRTYEDFINKVELKEGGVELSATRFHSLISDHFGSNNVHMKNNASLIFDPDFMNNVAASKGVIAVQFKTPGHADNIRTLRVFKRNPLKNTITFRQRLFNSNITNFYTKNKPIIVIWVK